MTRMVCCESDGEFHSDILKAHWIVSHKILIDINPPIGHCERQLTWAIIHLLIELVSHIASPNNNNSEVDILPILRRVKPNLLDVLSNIYSSTLSNTKITHLHVCSLKPFILVDYPFLIMLSNSSYKHL